MLCKGVEIPLTCPTWFYFIQDKSENYVTCPGTSLKKVSSMLFFIFDNIIMNFQYYVKNSVDPDQLASSEAS